MARMNGLQEILEEKGGFSYSTAIAALAGISSKSKAESQQQEFVDDVFEATEKIAIWARGELKTLRNFELESRLEREGRVKRNKSESPVLHGNAISRTVLSDLAITLLQTVEEPGNNLVLLLVELLNVDKHRQLNANRNQPENRIAAQIIAQDPTITNSELVQLTGRDKATISRWRRDPDFKELVLSFKSVFENPLDTSFMHQKPPKTEL